MTEPTRTRGRYAKTAERRAAIARAALDLVLEKGHRALTTAEVAARAGMSERSMLYHFPTRDHILVAAMELADEEAAERVAGGEDSRDTGRVPSTLARHAMENQATIRLFASLAPEASYPEHPAHEYMMRHNSLAISGFADMVSQRQKEGLAHPDIDPQSTARQMMAAWQGLQAQWLLDPSFDLADEVGQAFRRLTGQPTMEARQKIDALLTSI